MLVGEGCPYWAVLELPLSAQETKKYRGSHMGLPDAKNALPSYEPNALPSVYYF